MYIWYMLIPGKAMASKPYPPSVRCDKNVPESYRAKKMFDTGKCPDTMIGNRWNCPNDVKVVVLIDLDFGIPLLGIDHPC